MTMHIEVWSVVKAGEPGFEFRQFGCVVTAPRCDGVRDSFILPTMYHVLTVVVCVLV
jgi:hypothetical protein